MDLSIKDKSGNFVLAMNYYESYELDNAEAKEKRMSCILIGDGAGIINMNGKSVPYIAPVILCMNEKESVIIKSTSSTEIRTIFFHPSIINDKFNFGNIVNLPDNVSVTVMQDRYNMISFIERNEKYSGKMSMGPLTYKRFEALFDAYKDEISAQRDGYWPCRSRSYLFEILFLINNLYSKNEMDMEMVNENTDDDINEVLLFLYNNYNKKITIDYLTKKFNINRTTLSEKFNKLVGETIITYVNKLRVNIAATLLRDTRVPVSEIMERVGFNDSSYFFRTFKRYKGQSPKEYRNEYCWVD